MHVSRSTLSTTKFAKGRRFRILDVGDVFTECLGAVPDTSISGRGVARDLAAIIGLYGTPSTIVRTIDRHALSQPISLSLLD